MEEDDVEKETRDQGEEEEEAEVVVVEECE